MGASILAFHLGDVELSAAFAEEARELITTLPDWPRRPFDEANSLVALACRRAIIDRDGAGALQLCEDAVDVGRRADDAYATGFSLFNVISFASATGNIDRMRSALAEAEGNPAPLSLSLGWHPHRATLFAVDGDLPRALEEAEKGLTLARKIGTVFPVMRALNQVASLSLRAGDPAKARACAEEALVMSRGIGEIFNGVQPALMNLAEAAIALGDGDTALQAIDEALKLPGAPRETLERLQTSAAELAKDNAS
jgi:tetratricopeptide (TPR) repeat protein